jgi:8-oxo-dGTP pyrophosphatase MutT (NUDIX family)
MRERAISLAQGLGTWVPPVPRDAATVCLLRDTAAGLEVFLMRRTTSMAFAAGMHVYPGGAVEVSDARVPLAGRGDLADVAQRLSVTDPAALVAAAARETFEECGVLLALDSDGVTPAVSDELEHDRAELVAGRLGFADLLRAHGLVVDDAALTPFGHWVTPQVEDRRYDTRFFVAAVPAHHDARELGGEADQVAWWRPGDAVAEWEQGRLPMLPPTVAALRDLAPYSLACDAIAAARSRTFVPLTPTPVVADDGGVEWLLLDGRTGEVVAPSREPPASETDGTGRQA